MVNFSAGLLVALQGILIVFAVLVILMVVLSIMKLFAKKDGAPAQKAPTAPASAPAVQIAESDEIIAVISAAVAAMSGDDPTKRLRVMSIKRQGSQMPLWSANNR